MQAKWILIMLAFVTFSPAKSTSQQDLWQPKGTG